MDFQELKQLMRIAIPLVLAQLAQNATSFVDTLMAGMLGKEALAGIAIGGTVFMFVSIVLSGVVLGVSAVVSQATGADDEDTCGRAIRQGFWLSVILFLPALVLFWNIYPILIWLGQPPSTAQASSGYLRAISWGLLPLLGSFALRGLLEGKSNTRPVMMVAATAVILNVFANNALMFGKYGLPKLGLIGTGVASSIVLTLVFVMLAIYSQRRYPDLNIFTKLRSPDQAMLTELLKVGAPIGMTLAFEASMFGAAAIGMGQLGTIPLAAHQIALQTASVSFMIPLGIAIATSVRVGQAIGAKNPVAAKVSGQTGLIVCAAVMSVFAIAFWTMPKSIISIYLDINEADNQPVVELAIQFLMIAGIFQVFDGIQVAGSLSLRGLKDTFAAMLLTLISYWIVGLPAGWGLCFGWNLGGQGLWLGMTLGLATAAILLSLRFRIRINREIRNSLKVQSRKLSN